MSWTIRGRAVILAALLAAIFVGCMKDEVELRYETMAIEVEDRCKLFSSSDKDKCKGYSRCYRAGIEAAYPRDAMREYAFKNRKAPSEIEQAHTALVRKCLSEAGVKAGG